MNAAPREVQRGEGEGPKPQGGDTDLGLGFHIDEDNEYLVS